MNKPANDFWHPLNPVERFNLELLTARMGHDVGDFADKLWANAADAAPRWSAKPEPVSRLGPTGDHRLSQVSTRDRGCANNAPRTDK